MHLIREQSASAGLIHIGLVKIRSPGAERSVGKSFQRANPQKWISEGMANADLRLIIHIGDQRSGIDSHTPFPALP